MSQLAPTFFEPDRRLPDVDLSPVAVPARSQLVGLIPLEKGSGDVESLWGYLHRLGDAHAIRAWDLVIRVLGQFKLEIFNRYWSSAWLGEWQHVMRAASGATFGARLATVLGRLNGVTDLTALTLEPVARTAGLMVRLRSNLAWCPHCLATDQIPHERLYWVVEGVTHCFHHGNRLEELCPACGKRPKSFSSSSGILNCSHCGELKTRVPPACNLVQSTEDDNYRRWFSGQIRLLLQAAQSGSLESRHLDVRDHNLRLMSALPEIGGITRLANQLGLGRATAWCWINEGRTMPLHAGACCAWLAGVDLPRLFSKKLSLGDVRYRPLPQTSAPATKRVRRASAPTDTTSLYLTALRLAAVNPFQAPRISELENGSGVHSCHPAYQDIFFRGLIERLRENERIFRKRERVWREICDVHVAAAKVVARGGRLTRARVGAEMRKPGCFGGPLARDYLKWVKRRLKAGRGEVLDAKRVPLDVRAYWSLENAPKTTKGG